MPKKILDGVVVSDKGNKSITVVVERKFKHPTLQKVVMTKKNIMYTTRKIHLKREIKCQLLKHDLSQKQNDLQF